MPAPVPVPVVVLLVVLVVLPELMFGTDKVGRERDEYEKPRREVTLVGLNLHAVVKSRIGSISSHSDDSLSF